MIFKDVQTGFNSCENAAYQHRFERLACDVLHRVQNSRISRTFKESSKFFTKIQELFKDFNNRHEIQGFFKGCGNPVRAIPKKKKIERKKQFLTPPSLRSTASRLRRSRSAALGLSPTSRHDPSFFRPADTPYFRHVSDLDLWLPDYLCWRRLNCKSKGLCSSDLVLVVYTCY